MIRPPSVDALSRRLARHEELAGLPRAMLVDAARAAIGTVAVGDGDPPDWDGEAVRIARLAKRRLLGPVINATGVLLHTNLGRAPIAQEPGGTDTMRYSNVELDLDDGVRGSRRALAEPLIQRLTGAEACLVVNNCAAAVVLVLAELARGRGVAVSRGELVEIGGGFRVPDVLEQSGARMVEIGTTNRTRLGDYARATGPETDVALLLKVHQSNYRITGFTEDVDVAALTTLGLPVVVDLGSGLLDSSTPWLADASGHVPSLPWLEGEPGVRQTLDAGADVVVVSGDKLLGGPQCGIIAGRSEIVERCARHPLARALRPGALVLGALQTTLLHYLRGEARAIPFWHMATLPVSSLHARAARLASDIGDPRAEVAMISSVPGGGTLPDRTIESAGIGIRGDIAAALREAPTPIVARVHEHTTFVDLRCVDPADDAQVRDAIMCALAGHVRDA